MRSSGRSRSPHRDGISPTLPCPWPDKNLNEFDLDDDQLCNVHPEAMNEKDEEGVYNGEEAEDEHGAEEPEEEDEQDHEDAWSNNSDVLNSLPIN